VCRCPSNRGNFTILGKALEAAVEEELIDRNPARAKGAMPKGRTASSGRPQLRYWSVQELSAFLSHVRSDRMYPLFHLAAFSGMRRGELLGLHWANVDLERGVLSVVHTLVAVKHEPVFGTPKTNEGRRSVPLDAGTVEVLRDHRKRQLEDQLSAGPWTAGSEHGPLVFTEPDGAALRPEAVSQVFDRRTKAAGLRRIRFHDLRHTYAVAALEAGMHPKVLQERLGHSTIAITMDTYSHVRPTTAVDQVHKVADYMRAGSQ
jgi:integrase